MEKEQMAQSNVKKYFSYTIDFVYGVVNKVSKLISLYILLIGIIYLCCYNSTAYLSNIVAEVLKQDVNKLISSGSIYRLSVAVWGCCMAVPMIILTIQLIVKMLIRKPLKSEIVEVISSVRTVLEYAACCLLTIVLNKIDAARITYDTILYCLCCFIVFKLWLSQVVNHLDIPSEYLKVRIKYNDATSNINKKKQAVSLGIDIFYGAAKKLYLLLGGYLLLIGVMCLCVQYPSGSISSLLVGQTKLETIVKSISNGSIFLVAVSLWICLLAVGLSVEIFKVSILNKENDNLFRFSMESLVAAAFILLLNKIESGMIAYDFIVIYTALYFVAKILIIQFIKRSGVHSYYFGSWGKFHIGENQVAAVQCEESTEKTNKK